MESARILNVTWLGQFSSTRYRWSGGKVTATHVCCCDTMDIWRPWGCGLQHTKFQKHHNIIYEGYRSSGNILQVTWLQNWVNNIDHQSMVTLCIISIHSCSSFITYLTSDFCPKTLHSYDAALQGLIGCLSCREIHTKTMAHITREIIVSIGRYWFQSCLLVR